MTCAAQEELVHDVDDMQEEMIHEIYEKATQVCAILFNLVYLKFSSCLD